MVRPVDSMCYAANATLSVGLSVAYKDFCLQIEPIVFHFLLKVAESSCTSAAARQCHGRAFPARHRNRSDVAPNRTFLLKSPSSAEGYVSDASLIHPRERIHATYVSGQPRPSHLESVHYFLRFRTWHFAESANCLLILLIL